MSRLPARPRVTAAPSRALARLATIAAAIAATLLPAPAAGAATPVARWSFGSGPVGSVFDDIAGRPLAMSRAPLFVADGPPFPGGNPNALSSGPQTMQGTASGTGIDGLAAFSVSFWLRLPPDLPAGVYGVVQLPGKVDIQVWKVVDPLATQAYIRMAVPRSGGSFTAVLGGFSDSPYYPADGRWHFVTASDDGAQAVIRVDEIRSNLATLRPVAPSSGIVVGPMRGDLDELTVWDGALTDDEAIDLRTCSVQGDVPVDECRALVALFRDTGGYSWLHRDGWLQTASPCTWYGVLCAAGHVYALALSDNGLAGALPPQLGLLTGLHVLQLARNALDGTVPPELSALTRLVTLDLYGNRLDGTIPATFGGLDALETLRLQENRLRGAVPRGLLGLRGHLTTLDVSSNRLVVDDADVRSWLASIEPDWQATQTAPVTDVGLSAAPPGSVGLHWTPIPYTADGGSYRVLASRVPGGLFVPVAETADKTAAGIRIRGLEQGATYDLSVQTTTPAHGGQQSDLVSDGTDPIRVTVPIDSSPTAADDAYVTDSGVPLVVDAGHGVLANDADPDHDPLEVVNASAPSHGALALTSLGGFTYTPDPGYVGDDAFTYRASDGLLESGTATVRIAVRPLARITIALQLRPRAATDIRFTGGLGTFLLDDPATPDGDAVPGTRTFAVPAGTYRVRVAPPRGLAAAGISCAPSTAATVAAGGASVAIRVGPGAAARCTFRVRRAGTVAARVFSDANADGVRAAHERWLAGRALRIYRGGALVASRRTGAGGVPASVSLSAGIYVACAPLPATWDTTAPRALDPVLGAPCVPVRIGAGGRATLTFGTRPRGA